MTKSVDSVKLSVISGDDSIRGQLYFKVAGHELFFLYAKDGAAY